MSKLKFNLDRRGVKHCPCGKSNGDGKFSPFVGYTDKGYCFGCDKIFSPDSAKVVENWKERKITLMIKATSFIDPRVLQQSLGSYNQNVLFRFIKKLTDDNTAEAIKQQYKIGTSWFWKGATVFWQIDIEGKIRNGKIMQYAMRHDENCFLQINCGRVKTNMPPVMWVSRLQGKKDFELRQCFFGEHLLATFPDRKVCILESEKSALIAAAYNPDYIWLACGGATGLTNDKIKVLENRYIILWPDLGKFELWSEKAHNMRKKLKNIVIITSDMLEHIATEDEREQGLDLADFLIRYEWAEYLKREMDTG